MPSNVSAIRLPFHEAGTSTLRAYHAPEIDSIALPKTSRPCASHTPHPFFAPLPPEGHLPGTLKKYFSESTAGALAIEEPSLSTPNAQKPLRDTLSRVRRVMVGDEPHADAGFFQPSAGLMLERSAAFFAGSGAALGFAFDECFAAVTSRTAIAMNTTTTNFVAFISQDLSVWRRRIDTRRNY